MKIKYLIPSLILAIVISFYMGLTYQKGEADRQVNEELASIRTTYTNNPDNSQTLSSDAILNLQNIAETEKLAHDVYTLLYEKTNREIFKNMAASEYYHLTLTRKYLKDNNYTDPTEGDVIGYFKNPDLAELYRDAVVLGMNSSDPETEVGVYLENVDIREIDIALAMKLPAELVKNIDILREGSVEHKKSFIEESAINKKTKP